MISKLLPLAVTGMVGASAFAAQPTLHSFKKQHLENFYWSEGAMLGDLNRDGNGDVAGTDLVTTSMLTWFSNVAGAFVPSGQHFCCFGAFILT